MSRGIPTRHRYVCPHCDYRSGTVREAGFWRLALLLVWLGALLEHGRGLEHTSEQPRVEGHLPESPGRPSREGSP